MEYMLSGAKSVHRWVHVNRGTAKPFPEQRRAAHTDKHAFGSSAVRPLGSVIHSNQTLTNRPCATHNHIKDESGSVAAAPNFQGYDNDRTQ
jgi:hypothetical protein